MMFVRGFLLLAPCVEPLRALGVCAVLEPVGTHAPGLWTGTS